jgi:hypothetical protein
MKGENVDKKEKDAWRKVAHAVIDIRFEGRHITDKAGKEKVDEAIKLIAEAIEIQFPTIYTDEE